MCLKCHGFSRGYLLIAGAIYYLDSQNPQKARTSGTDITRSNFPKYREIVNPSGYVNVDPSTGLGTGKITIGELVGKKVVMVDFWTYSCINCQRTSPILNAWYEKYRDKGLEIICIHTPEFEFEKNIDNVRDAVKKENIKYPVVLDNDYSTWNAYGNRYWPRQYLIDLEGKIVFDHIGEFSKAAHVETEKKIQELLKLKEEMSVAKISSPDPNKPLSPETYLGSDRAVPSQDWKFEGDWDIQPEFATNRDAGAKIIYKYKAKDVFLVASAKNDVKVRVKLDGQLVGGEKGEDVGEDGIVTVNRDGLYKIIQDSTYGIHTLELEILSPGLMAFAFTFG